MSTAYGYIFGAGLAGLVKFSMQVPSDDLWPERTCPPRNLMHPTMKVFAEPIPPMVSTMSGELDCQREREMLGL